MKDVKADSLRGIAALNVVICHFVCGFFPSLLHKNYPTRFDANPNPDSVFNIISSPLFTLLYNGQFAVIIFFVLSGYVLTIPYFNGNKSAIEKRFYGRYFRLNIPVAFAIIFSYFLYKSGLYFNQPAANITSSNWLKNFYSENIPFSLMLSELSYQSVLFGSNKLVGPVWTLEIEFIGSLFLLAFYLFKPKNLLVIPTIAMFVFLYFTFKDLAIYFIAIFLGSYINLMKISKKWNSVLFVAGLYFGSYQFYSSIYEILPAIGIFEIKNFYVTIGSVLVTTSIVNGFGSQILQHKFFQFLGKVSFSVYLVHVAVLTSLGSFLYTIWPQTPVNFFSVFAIYIVTSYALAVLFEKYIDRNAIIIAKLFSDFVFQVRNNQNLIKIYTP